MIPVYCRHADRQCKQPRVWLRCVNPSACESCQGDSLTQTGCGCTGGEAPVSGRISETYQQTVSKVCHLCLAAPAVGHLDHCHTVDLLEVALLKLQFLGHWFNFIYVYIHMRMYMPTWTFSTPTWTFSTPDFQLRLEAVSSVTLLWDYLRTRDHLKIKTTSE